MNASPLMGEGRVGVMLVQGTGNRRCNTLGVAKRIVVPEANDTVTLGLNECRSFKVALAAVLSAIILDHDA